MGLGMFLFSYCLKAKNLCKKLVYLISGTLSICTGGPLILVGFKFINVMLNI
jgi:hypothetical protein